MQNTIATGPLARCEKVSSKTARDASAHAVMTCDVVRDIAGLERMAGEWRSLEAVVTGVQFFQSCDWCLTVWRTLSQNVEAMAEQPRVVVVRRAGQPVLIWPLALRRTFGVTIVQDLSEPFGQYSDALIDPGQPAEAALDMAWREISRWRPDALILRRVRSDAALKPWLTANGRCVGEPTSAPQVELSEFADFAAYHKSIAAKTRKNLRNYRNRLSRNGELVHRVVSDAAQREQLVERCFALRSEWLASSGLSSTAFMHDAFEPLVKRLAVGGAGCPNILMMQLMMRREAQNVAAADNARDDDCIDVAIQWGFEHAGRYYAFMSARNPAFDAYSPGRLHLEDVLQVCAERNLGTADLLAPNMPYKSSWSTSCVQVDCFGIGATMKGRLLVHGWHGRLRPALKSIAMKVPKSIRAAVVDTAKATMRLLPQTR